MVQTTDFQSLLDKCGVNVIRDFEGKKNQHAIVKKIQKNDIFQEDLFEP